MVHEALILVVDDNATNRLVASAHLGTAGYAVATAEGGLQAVEAVRNGPPDLVLLDVLMPGIDGFETCRRIRALPSAHDLPIVFLTALTDVAEHQKAVEAGADDFLAKPINRTELLTRVRSLLRMKALRGEVAQLKVRVAELERLLASQDG